MTARRVSALTARSTATAATRLAFQVPLAFAALQNIGFVGLDNARELVSFPGFCGEKPVPPAECGIDGKPASLDRRAKRQPIRKTGSKGKPLVFAMKTRQGCTRRSIASGLSWPRAAIAAALLVVVAGLSAVQLTRPDIIPLLLDFPADKAWPSFVYLIPGLDFGPDCGREAGLTFGPLRGLPLGFQGL